MLPALPFAVRSPAARSAAAFPQPALYLSSLALALSPSSSCSLAHCVLACST